MKSLKEDLKYLRLSNLFENIETYLQDADKQKMSHLKLLKLIFRNEVDDKIERARKSRVTRSKIPIPYVIETFPFDKQKQLNRDRLLNRHDSLDYITEYKNLVFIGPASSGKTGLATCFLVNALNHGYSGRFITFYDLMEELFKSHADHSGKVVINKYSKLACLVIDNVGYLELEKNQISLFFNLIQQRHKKTSTVITTNLGFNEWVNFLKDPHLTSALVHRITDGGHVVNLKNCSNLREPPDVD